MQRAIQIFMQIVRFLRPAPGIFLFFIAPIIGALLTGTVPTGNFFQFLPFLALCILYGGGAIIARELMLYWNKGWPTLLLLGAAFGIINQGLLDKSFFDPHWRNLGTLVTYGRLLDVNWVWIAQSISVQTVFSIALPILIVNLIFPKRRVERWAGPRALLVLMIAFGLAVILGSLFLYTYRPALLLYLAACGVAVVCVALARIAPRALRVTKNIDVPRPLFFGTISFLGVLTLYITNWLLPTTLAPFWVAIVLTFLLDVVIGIVLLRISGNGVAWTERHQVAFVSGALAFFILLSPVIEITQRQYNYTGFAFLAVVIGILLYLLTRRIRKREQKQQVQQIVI